MSLDQIKTPLHETHEQTHARRPKREAVVGHVALIAETIDPNRKIEVPDKVMSIDEMNRWAKEHTFGDHDIRGTFRSEDGENYLYIKNCLKVSDEADVAPALAMARHLTSVGALNPDTQWGVFKNDKNEYQLFPVSPALTPMSIDDLYDDPDRFAAFTQTPNHPDSYMQQWCRRVDPDYAATSSTPWNETPPANSAVGVLNTYEALPTNNWGYDEKGNFYPVDVEVINLQGNMDTVRKWYADQTAGQTRA